MILRKGNIGIEIEAGSRNYLFQTNGSDNGGGGKNTSKTGDSKKYYNDPENKTLRGIEADIQAEILVDATNEFDEGDKGLSKQEYEMFKKLDKILDKVDVVASQDLSHLHFIVETGETFTMNRGKYKGDLLNGGEVDGKAQESILKTAYKEYTQDHKLTKKEIEMIEKIDEVLPGAAILINPVTGDATLASPTGTSHLTFPKGSGNGRG